MIPRRTWRGVLACGLVGAARPASAAGGGRPGRGARRRRSRRAARDRACPQVLRVGVDNQPSSSPEHADGEQAARRHPDRDPAHRRAKLFFDIPRPQTSRRSRSRQGAATRCTTFVGHLLTIDNDLMARAVKYRADRTERTYFDHVRGENGPSGSEALHAALQRVEKMRRSSSPTRSNKGSRPASRGSRSTARTAGPPFCLTQAGPSPSSATFRFVSTRRRTAAGTSMQRGERARTATAPARARPRAPARGARASGPPQSDSRV